MNEITDRSTIERRQNRRWASDERRRGGDRREGAYKRFARQLPEAFLKMKGSPRKRVMLLVQHYCCGCDESLQADLAQALLPTLQTVVTLDGGVVSEEHRIECEEAVERCVMLNEQATGRWDPACMEQ